MWMMMTLMLAIGAADAPPAAVPFSLVAEGAMEKYGVLEGRLRIPLRKTTLRSSPPKGVTVPPDTHGLAWAAIPMGPVAGIAELRMAVDESNPAEPRFYADLDGDGDVAEHGALPWQPGPVIGSGAGARCRSGRLRVGADPSAETAVSIVVYRFDVEEARARRLPPDELYYYADFCMLGEAEVAGRPTKVALFDASAAGNFTYPSGKTGLVFSVVDCDGNGAFEADEVFRAGTVFKLGSDWAVVSRIPADGRRPLFKKTEPPPATPPRKGGLPKAGDTAPAFTSPALSGESIKFPDDYRGKVVLLDFWATWCGPCVKEIPTVVGVYEKYKELGFDVLGISFDRPNQAAHVSAFIKARNMPWRQAYEGKLWSTEVGALYVVRSIPYMFLVDGDTGKILAAGGDLRGEGLEPAVRKAILEKEKNKSAEPTKP